MPSAKPAPAGEPADPAARRLQLIASRGLD
jgi:hypothetical protein